MTPQIDDDDIRHMLHTKAAEVQVSDDAWDKITTRLDEKPVVRTLGRRLALAGAAAAAVAGTVVVANLPTSSNVATGPTTTETTGVTAPVTELPAHVFAAPVGADAEGAARAYLVDRTGGDVGQGEVVSESGEAAEVLFREGPVASDVFLRRIDGRWLVDSAATDLAPIYDAVYEQGLLSAEVGIEADGELMVRTRGSDGGDEVTTQPVARLDQVPVRAALPGERFVVVGVVLRTQDGTIGVSETWVTDHTDDQPDPGLPQGSIVAVWPAVDSVGLATLQEDADVGHRPDLLDPQAVAGAFLAELLPRGETPTSYTVGEFQQGDTTSGEVPYTLSDGSSGVVLVRTTGEPGAIWTVAGATSDDMDIVTVRREETHLVADVRADRGGTLTWTGATSVELQAGQIVSIGRPDVPLGAYPVVVRLMDGDRTLAIAARLG